MNAARADAERVLIVDDDPDTRAMIARIVGGAGYRALCVADGGAALDAMEECPSLVLLDAVMPGMDGFETCRRIKAVERWRAIPVIFMTGLADTAHVVAGLQAGGIDYLTKPLVLPELLARVRAHIATARETRALQRAVDASGRALFGMNDRGELLWATPEARRLLAKIDSDGICGETTAVLARIAPGESVRCALGSGEGDVVIDRIRTDGADRLFRVGERDGEGREDHLRRAFALTPREASVLRWLTQGKSSREISGVLNISPRTVDKHVEQIFRKMKVQSRSAAAVSAIETLGDH